MSCPHIWTSDEGTNGCELAGVTAKQWAELKTELAAVTREREALTDILLEFTEPEGFVPTFRTSRLEYLRISDRCQDPGFDQRW